MTAWIITKDKLFKDLQDLLPDITSDKGLTGPRCATENDIARLRAGEGRRFRMLDDDGNIYYYGRILEDDECTSEYEGDPELAPLDNFGAPNAGAVQIEYAEGWDKKGNVVWLGLL
jgi:hypothetical protein